MMMTTWLLALVLAGEAAGTRSVEDDLALVKKAVAARPTAPATTPAVVAQEGTGAKGDPREREATRAAGRKGTEPQWLRVRVAERSGKKVSINLPLPLVRAMGEDWPFELHCGRPGTDRAMLTLGEVLRALDSGQDLVQVEEEDATVRVWVE
jgi:hypothetical protein